MKTKTMLLFILILVSIWISPALPQGATIHSARAAFTNLQNPASPALLGKQISEVGQYQTSSGSQSYAPLTVSFDHYTIKYYANPELYAQIDCFSGTSKVGEIGFYAGQDSGGRVNQIFNNQILIYYPISQFPDIINMLRYTQGPLNLQMTYVVSKSGETCLESGEMQQVGVA
jgi:hypothetical protein